MKIVKFLKKFTHRSLVCDARSYGKLYLPLVRSNEGLSDDQEYVNSAIEQVNNLLDFCELTPNTCILDFGCGQGRFAIGLLMCIPNIGSYYGIDTSEESIKWCKKYLQRYHRNFTFIHLPAHNPRYNPSIKSRPVLPLKANFFNVVFLNSVFSHMMTDDIKFYLSQFYKVLRKNGIMYTTAFIEEDVPNVEENPKDYLGIQSKGPLHRVRYERSFFLSLIEDAGFSILDFKHQKIQRTKQSVVVAKKPD